MSTLRTALTAITLALLALGYAASQAAALQGRAPEYARAVDQRPIHWLALGVLGAALVLALVREKDGAT